MDQVKTIQDFYDIAQDMPPGSFIPISSSVMKELALSYGHGPAISQDLTAIAQINQIFGPLDFEERIRILSYLTSQEVARGQTDS